MKKHQAYKIRKELLQLTHDWAVKHVKTCCYEQGYYDIKITFDNTIYEFDLKQIIVIVEKHDLCLYIDIVKDKLTMTIHV